MDTGIHASMTDFLALANHSAIYCPFLIWLPNYQTQKSLELRGLQSGHESVWGGLKLLNILYLLAHLLNQYF